MKMNNAFASARTQYCKIEEARARLDHAHAPRNGYTSSQNIVDSETANNFGFYYHNAKSCAEALDMMMEKHKLITGKKVRKDNNILFEHIIWLNEERYSFLEKKYGHERLKKEVMKRLRAYAESIKTEFGFEPLGIDFHLDEGHYKNGKFVRNIHAHCQFFNYDWKLRRAPLRGLIAKGKDANGKTNRLNPNFERIQTLTADAFNTLGFKRGISKNITNREHLQKEQFVKKKIEVINKSIKKHEDHNSSLRMKIEEKNRQLSEIDYVIKEKENEISVLSQKLHDLYTTATELKAAIARKAKDAILLISRKLERSNDANIGIRRR